MTWGDRIAPCNIEQQLAMLTTLYAYPPHLRYTFVTRRYAFARALRKDIIRKQGTSNGWILAMPFENNKEAGSL